MSWLGRLGHECREGREAISPHATHVSHASHSHVTHVSLASHAPAFASSHSCLSCLSRPGLRLMPRLSAFAPASAPIPSPWSCPLAMRIVAAAPKRLAGIAPLARNHLMHWSAAVRARRRSLRGVFCVSRRKPRSGQALCKASLFFEGFSYRLHLPVKESARTVNDNKDRIRRDNRVFRLEKRGKAPAHRKNVFSEIMTRVPAFIGIKHKRH